MDLKQYLAQENPIRNPSVILTESDYRILNNYKDGIYILIEDVAAKYPNCSGVYFVPSGKKRCMTIDHNFLSCFTIQ
jgi:hypothetical protein